jgi:hypothetical protein
VSRVWANPPTDFVCEPAIALERLLLTANKGWQNHIWLRVMEYNEGGGQVIAGGGESGYSN